MVNIECGDITGKTGVIETDVKENRAVKLLEEYSIQDIMILAKRKSPQARHELMHVVTDLIEEKLSDKEKNLVSDILINLVRQAVRDMREAVSAKLAHRDDVPEKLILHLAHDEIEVAQHVLLNSPLLEDEDLLFILKSKPEDYAVHIAGRRELSGRVIDAIADQRKLSSSTRLAHNDHILLTEHAFKVFGEMALEHKELCEPVLTRRDVPLDLAEKLYRHVGKSMQSYIEQKFGDKMSSKIVSDVTDELVATSRGQYKPTQEIRDHAARINREGKLTLKETIDTLRRGQIPSFIAMFSEYTNLSESMIESILMEPSGRSLAIVSRYHDLSRADYVAIYLMVHKLRSYEQIVPQNDLQKAMKYYDRIDHALARRLMRQIKNEDRH